MQTTKLGCNNCDLHIFFYDAIHISSSAQIYASEKGHSSNISITGLIDFSKMFQNCASLTISKEKWPVKQKPTICLYWHHSHCDTSASYNRNSGKFGCFTVLFLITFFSDITDQHNGTNWLHAICEVPTLVWPDVMWMQNWPHQRRLLEHCMPLHNWTDKTTAVNVMQD